MNIRSKVFYTYVLFVLAYTLITLLPEPAKLALHKYHLQPTKIRLLDFTILIPLFVMWFAAFYGYDRLHRYSQLIKDNQDGKQIGKIASGLFVLAVGLPLESITSSLLGLYARSHPSLLGLATVLPHYVDIVCVLVAFLFIAAGIRGLSVLSNSRPSYVMSHIVVLTVIVLGVVFCSLIARAHAQHSLTPSYHVPYSMVMLTFAIPYMYVWFLGLFSVAEVHEYSKHVEGIVYRKGWNRLIFGLGSIIIVDIMLQYLGTLYSWVNGLSLAGILALLYVLLFLLAGGFIVVALGARDLMKIEEV